MSKYCDVYGIYTGAWSVWDAVSADMNFKGSVSRNCMHCKHKMHLPEDVMCCRILHIWRTVAWWSWWNWAHYGDYKTLDSWLGLLCYRDINPLTPTAAIWVQL